MKENLGKKVKELNARIEEIRDQRTRAETRKETLLGQLKGQIKEYEKLYGIKLSGEGYSGVEKAISGEMDRVSKEIQKEYDLKVSVVEAIDSGNIDEAFRLLGMENPNKVSEEDVEEEVEGGVDAGDLVDGGEEDQPTDIEYEEDVAKTSKKSGGKQSKQSGSKQGKQVKQGKQGANSVSLNTQSAEEVFDEFNGDDDEDFGLDGFEFDDPDDAEDTDDYAGPTGPSGKTANSTGNASSDLGGFGIEFDDDDDDFGFGDILSGSKFE